MQLAEQLDDKFAVGDGCWLWSAYTDADGYGKLRRDGKSHYAHRLAYELFVGPIPPGLELDHLCRNRACVRPDHLQPVTHRTNVLRGESLQAQNARKTHCPKGHPLDAIWGGQRACRTCCNARKRLARRNSIG